MARILFTEPAEYDLIKIENYIRDTLKNPNAAIQVTDAIVKKSYSLQHFPKEHSIVKDNFLAVLGFRMTSSDNYNIFYIYDDDEDIVHIVRILYNRADWQNILR
ncbi:MAG: type II toxin-antitoxin system RelE/ParE family toxin [Lachnospiraceae bacterium]